MTEQENRSCEGMIIRECYLNYREIWDRKTRALENRMTVIDKAEQAMLLRKQVRRNNMRGGISD